MQRLWDIRRQNLQHPSCSAVGPCAQGRRKPRGDRLKFDKNELRLQFHCYILISRKCPRKILFEHTVSPPLQVFKPSYGPGWKSELGFDVISTIGRHIDHQTTCSAWLITLSLARSYIFHSVKNMLFWASLKERKQMLTRINLHSDLVRVGQYW